MKSLLIHPQVFIKFSNEYNYLEKHTKGKLVKSKADVRRIVNDHKFYDKAEIGRFRSQQPQWVFSLDIAYAFDFNNIEAYDTWSSRVFTIGDIINKEQGISHGFVQDCWLVNEEYSIIKYPNGYMDIMGDDIVLKPGTLRQMNPVIKTQKESELDKVFTECKKAPLYEIHEVKKKVR
ncbi:MAG: hypothetical protein FWG80_00115 [Alphaproteobacteria bacterium]|nr:hypothetical protein [Alphaproteobacteria bacterium]